MSTYDHIVSTVSALEDVAFSRQYFRRTKLRQAKVYVTFFEVVNFPSLVSHIVFTVSFGLIFNVSLPIKIVKLLPLSNRIPKFLNFAFPLRVFIHPWRIGE